MARDMYQNFVIAIKDLNDRKERMSEEAYTAAANGYKKKIALFVKNDVLSQEQADQLNEMMK